MKNHTSKKILFLCILIVSKFSIASALTSNANSFVKASQYCDFLNQVAAEDPDHLFDQKMSTDPAAACIVRLGTPGNFHYQVIDGTENAPITYITEINKARYCDLLRAAEAGRLQAYSAASTSTFNFNSDIEDVSSNNDSFQVEAASTMFTLASSSSTSTSTSNVNSCIEDVSSAAALLGLLAAPELMLRRGPAEAAPLAAEGSLTTAVPEPLSPRALTLDDFRSASQAHPTASRLVIKQDARGNQLLQPQEAAGGVFNKDTEENKAVLRSLRAALKEEYPEEKHPELDVEKLLPGSGKNEIHLPGNHSSLSSERLLEVFRKIDHELQGKKMRATSSMLVASAAPSSSQTLTAEDLYKKANLLSDQAQDARNTRDALQSAKQRKEEALQKAEELFEQEKAAFEQINLHKTTLGKFSRNAEKASKILGSLTIPIAGKGAAEI